MGFLERARAAMGLVAVRAVMNAGDECSHDPTVCLGTDKVCSPAWADPPPSLAGGAKTQLRCHDAGRTSWP